MPWENSTPRGCGIKPKNVVAWAMLTDDTGRLAYLRMAEGYETLAARRTAIG
jgi:hypothetical protein